MLEQSQKLTDGLIIYSVLVSDYEKLDFKNDALAGILLLCKVTFLLFMKF